MAWLKGLAGKAEDLLNQIDQNAAVAFHSEKKDHKIEPLTEVKWDNPIKRKDLSPQNVSAPPSANGMPAVKSSPNLQEFKKIGKPPTDDALIEFLNQTENSQKAPEIRSYAPPNSEGSSFIPVKGESLSGSSVSSRSGSKRNTPQDEVLLEIPQVTSDGNSPSFSYQNDEFESLKTENMLLKNELRTLNHEMSLLLQRAKSAEKECAELQQKAGEIKRLEENLLSAKQEIENLRSQAISKEQILKKLELEHSQFVQTSVDSTDEHSHQLRAAGDQIKMLQEELQSLKTEHNKEIAVIKQRLSSREIERNELSQKLTQSEEAMAHAQQNLVSLQQQCERFQAEIKDTRSELDQYRSRAQRILQDKEKLITELRGEGNGTSGSATDDTTFLELSQLRQERELLREETIQLSSRLQAVRNELQETERKLMESREQWTATHASLQENLSEESQRRQAAEEDCRVHREELQSVREELTRQCSVLANRVKERESELTRLRNQLATRQQHYSPNDEVESRLHMLTQTLVQKQSALENVTTEKNALRLQLEKLEKKHQETLTLLHQDQMGIINMNDTDDAKAQVPSFFVETPFDNGMTRRVKRAYSSLDAVSIRTGVFLRRYPLARILVLSYMVLLHLWVMLVLFTSTPAATV